jgi:hypothetical protein
LVISRNARGAGLTADIYIVAAKRSPIGKLNGSLAGLAAADIGSQTPGKVWPRCASAADKALPSASSVRLFS